MARIITKELAEKIAAKLGATIISGSAHDLACIYHEGVLIAQFGIRRGSEKDKGHDHVPEAIHLGPGKAKRLGQCPMTKKQWLDVMRQKGQLPAAREAE